MFSADEMNTVSLLLLHRETGKETLGFNLPDSITQWTVEGVELSSRTGMCVANPHSFTVTKEFFLKVRLPYQAVRGTLSW